MRTEMHRLRAGTRTPATRVAGSAVWQVFDGSGVVAVGDERYEVATGDLFAVPSWAPVTIETDGGLDAFRFGDDPVFEALGLARTEVSA
jgi:gentisate 1,2-dioxygenase